MKSVTDIANLRNVRSMHTTGKRSIPRVHSSAYIDIYMLQKEKERLEREESVIDKRKNVIKRRVEEVEKEIEILEKSTKQQEEQIRERCKKREYPEDKRWKTINLGY